MGMNRRWLCLRRTAPQRCSPTKVRPGPALSLQALSHRRRPPLLPPKTGSPRAGAPELCNDDNDARFRGDGLFFPFHLEGTDPLYTWGIGEGGANAQEQGEQPEPADDDTRVGLGEQSVQAEDQTFQVSVQTATWRRRPEARSWIPKKPASGSGSESLFRDGVVCPTCGCCSSRWTCENLSAETCPEATDRPKQGDHVDGERSRLLHQHDGRAYRVLPPTSGGE
jgi:hypothetical protein